MDINSENLGVLLKYSFKSTGDELLGRELEKTKLIDWENFNISSGKNSIYVPPEFQDNSFLIFAISQKWILARKWLIKNEWNSKTLVHPVKKNTRRT